jgi:diguanylate cyclase (GGDEF)-like protein
MPPAKKTILVVDDDKSIRRLITTTIEKSYKVIEASDGLDAIEKITKNPIDLVILDINMPGLDGLKVCHFLRRNPTTIRVPIIMLTSKTEREDKIYGIRAGADDYITKPFDPVELYTRIEMHLRRFERDTLSNPLTGLPGNLPIEQALVASIESNDLFAAIYADLDNFKAFNDHYGFLKGDEAIKLTAKCIMKAMEIVGSEKDDFVGHIGGDDFLIITTVNRYQQICEEIIRLFDSQIPALYARDDASKGGIHSIDRRGMEHFFTVMTISLSVITNELSRYVHPAQVSQVAAELKKVAKKVGKSNYVVDRRRR